MINYTGRTCYIVLREGDFTVQLAHTVPTDPVIAEELLHMNLVRAYEEMLMKRERRRSLEIEVYGENNG